MQLIQYPHATAFLRANQEWLAQNEALNSLLLGLTLDAEKKETDENFYFSVNEEETIQLCGIQTPGRFLILYTEDHLTNDTSSALADFLEREKPNLPGLLGPKTLVLDLAHFLKNTLDWDFEIVYKQLVYQLQEVKYNPSSSGQMRTATPADVRLVGAWMHKFVIEALNEDDVEAARKTAKQKIKNGEVFLWYDKAVVTMCCVARPTRNGISVNYVYTPVEYRKKGYGTKIVAEVSTLMLARGYRFCTLFTDIENPTSNAIYQRIGYELVGEFRSVKFLQSAIAQGQQ